MEPHALRLAHDPAGLLRAGHEPTPGSGYSRSGMKPPTGRFLRVLAGAAVFVLALWLLHRELRHYDLRQVLAVAKATPREGIVLALLCSAASYYLLTFYDVLALHDVGRRLSYGRVLLASFTSQVVSHNLGLAGIGGSALRYRIYTAWGLSLAEIAQVIASCALTFWIGFLFVGGVVFVVAPIELPAALHAVFPTLRPLGIAFLVPAAALCLWSLLVRKPLRIGSWSFAPPSGRTLFLQLVLGVVDWVVASSVLFVLLRGSHGLSFFQVMSVFLAAQAAGMISHVPAGLGVFDAALFYLLRDHASTTDVAGALLVYRSVYYLVPLGLGALLLVGLEVSSRRAQLAAAQRWLQPVAEAIVPRALAFTTSLAGAVLLLTGALPAEGRRMAWIRDVVPLPLVELSHFLGSLVGAGLLILAHGLLRRIDAAWWASVLLLAGGIVLALARGLDYEEAGLLAAMLLVLLPFHGRFHRRASLLHDALRPGWWLHVGMVVVSALWLGSLAFRHVDYAHELWWHFAYHGDASRFLRASAGLLALLAIAGTARLFRIVPPELPLPDEAELERVRAILAREDETTGHLALLGDKRLLFHEDGTSFVMFAVQGSSWIAMGDPVGGSERVRRELVWRLRELAEHAGGRAVFYQVAEERLGWYAEAGFSLLKLGEEARVDLATFKLEGGAHKHLRASLHRMEREGVRLVLLAPAEVRANLERLRAISDAWLATRNTREKGFSLGSFEPEYLARCEVAVVVQGERWLGFANLLLGAPGSELSIDLMRHVPDAPNGLMDFLFTGLFELARQRGYRWFSLGMAPLGGLESRTSAPVWNHIAGLVFRHGERFYNFQGLRQYKAKFDPVWRARYLAAPGGLLLPGVLVDVSALISGGLRATVAR